MAKKKGKGIETGRQVTIGDLPDEKTKELIKKYTKLTDEDPLPGDTREVVHLKSLSFVTEIREDKSGLDLVAMEVGLDVYSRELDGDGNVADFSLVELPEEYKTFRWNKDTQPAIPPDDELDGDGNVVREKGVVRGEIPTLETLMSDGRKSQLLDTVRQSLFNEIKSLLPAWSSGVEIEL